MRIEVEKTREYHKYKKNQRTKKKLSNRGQNPFEQEEENITNH